MLVSVLAGAAEVAVAAQVGAQPPLHGIETGVRSAQIDGSPTVWTQVWTRFCHRTLPLPTPPTWGLRLKRKKAAVRLPSSPSGSAFATRDTTSVSTFSFTL